MDLHVWSYPRRSYILPSFIEIHSEVLEPLGVEICPFPLLWLLAFTTTCTTVQAVMSDQRLSTFIVACNCRVNDMSEQLDEIANTHSLLQSSTEERIDVVIPVLSKRLRNLEFQVRLLIFGSQLQRPE